MQSNKRAGISRWWRVAGGLSVNLALGTLYAWSVFVAPLETQFGWRRADTSMVFTIAVIVFALSFVVAGRLQDRFGPLPCSLTCGILVSTGFYLCSYTTELGFLYVCFGLIGGLGNGFGYATPIPVMAKWFPNKRGLAVGLAVGGYGAGFALGAFDAQRQPWGPCLASDPERPVVLLPGGDIEATCRIPARPPSTRRRTLFFPFLNSPSAISTLPRSENAFQ